VGAGHERGRRQVLVGLVRSKGWRYEYSVGGRAARLPGRAEDLLSHRDRLSVALRMWPAPDLLAIFWPFTADRIDVDVDLRELQGQERLDALCAFMRAVGRRVGKPVLMRPEGFDAPPVTITTRSLSTS
jgi:hypothetical protein